MSQVKMKKGDTLIEVVLSFVMFSLVVAISISVMFSSISGAEAASELTLARVEIDSQSETMRFIHESYTVDHSYSVLWDKIMEQVIFPSDSTKLPELGVTSCTDLYKDNFNNDPMTIDSAKAFILNPRQINNGATEGQPNYYGYTLIASDNPEDREKFTTSSLNPRIVYTKNSSLASEDEAVVGPEADTDGLTTDDTINNESVFNVVYRVEGMYDFLVKESSEPDPPHYDFHVYTCWYAPGADRPTTIGTVTRLYNPGYVNGNTN